MGIEKRERPPLGEGEIYIPVPGWLKKGVDRLWVNVEMWWNKATTGDPHSTLEHTLRRAGMDSQRGFRPFTQDVARSAYPDSNKDLQKRKGPGCGTWAVAVALSALAIGTCTVGSVHNTEKPASSTQYLDQQKP